MSQERNWFAEMGIPEHVPPPPGGYSGRGFPDDPTDFAGRDRFFAERGLSWERDFNDHAAAMNAVVEGDTLVIEFGKRRLVRYDLALPGSPSEVWDGEDPILSLKGGQKSHPRVFARYRKTA